MAKTDIRRTRISLVTEVKLSFPNLSGFANEYSANISLGGIFVQSNTPTPMGTLVQLEFLLDNDAQLIKAVGEVVWTRSRSEGAHKPAGMGIRFQALDEHGRSLILGLMERHLQSGGEPFDIREPGSGPGPPSTADTPPTPKARNSSNQGRDSLPRRPSGPLATSAPASPPGGQAAQSHARQTHPEPRPGATPSTAPQLVHRPPPADGAPRPALAQAVGSPFHPPPKRAWYTQSNPFFLALVLALLVALGGLGLLWVRQTAVGENLNLMAEVLPPTTPPSTPVRPTRATSPNASRESDPSLDQGAGVSASAAVNGSHPPSPSSEAVLSRIESIDVELEEGTTLLRIRGNGRFNASNYSHFRLEARPFREIIRVVGVDQPFDFSRLETSTPQLDGVRVGFHPRASANELHIVLDLATQNARVTRIQPQDGTLLVWLN